MPQILLFRQPFREFGIIFLTASALALELLWGGFEVLLLVVGLLGSAPTLVDAVDALFERRISIETFNALALGVAFAIGDMQSVAFIVLMLAFASLLEWHTETRSQNAIEELLKLKPEEAYKEEGGQIHVIPTVEVKEGDIVVIKSGARVPVDGEVVFGTGYLNEASVTGEAIPKEKIVGDTVLSSTICESGVIKIRATNVGADSTLERMARLIEQAAEHKSKSEKLADRFAALFLPAVVLLGLAVYFFTHNLSMVAALFLVACADDMAVAIPLGMAASLGKAARRGVIIKGGEWLNRLGTMKMLVLDKTGTLTYGAFAIRQAHIEAHMDPERFWGLLGAAERYSEHPIGRAIFRECVSRVKQIPEPESVDVRKGQGISAKVMGYEVLVGDERILGSGHCPSEKMREILRRNGPERAESTIVVLINGECAGVLLVADVPREEAKATIAELRELGIERIIMFTGDNEGAARAVCDSLGITEFRAGMKPEDKLSEIEALSKKGMVGMVGDGINDAPALTRADVGIAMGQGGTAVAVEAADVVILSDNLARLPEMIRLSRKTFAVIQGDTVIWVVSNLVGFTLVFTSVLGPALAAFYNFATDFFPLINSARLFRGEKV